MLNSTYFLLFFEYFKIGLFTFGGGYASLPFLYQLIDTYHWFSHTQLTQMIAISGLTPGPVGLNMATYSGYSVLGIKGAIISSFALVLPMIIVTSQVFRLYRKFSQNACVKSVLYILRPTSCALIASVAFKLIYNLILKNSFSLALIDYKALLVVLILFFLSFKLPRNPIIYISIAAIFGVVFILKF